MPQHRKLQSRREVRYRVIPLYITPEDNATLCINNQGDILWLDAGELRHSGRWALLKNTSKNKRYNQVATAGLNNAGTVVGDISGEENGAYIISFGKAVVWHHGKMKLVGPVPDLDETGDAINNSGDVLMTSAGEDNINLYTYSILLYRAGRIIEIGQGKGECLNDRDQVVYMEVKDSSFGSDGDTVLWRRGKTQVFHVPHGYVSRGIVTTRLNNKAQAVGTVETGRAGFISRGEYTSSDISHAFLWQKGQMRDLGTLGGDDSSALDINNSGEVVGWAETAPPNHQGKAPADAFLWQNGKMTDLNDLIPARSGWVLQRAEAVNDHGQIAGLGNKGGFLLVPVSRSGTTARRAVFIH